MTLKEIAEELVAGCREGRESANLARLYAETAASVEAFAMDPSQPRETLGLQGIRGKHDWWEGAMEVRRMDVTGPFLHGDDRFAVIFSVAFTEKESGSEHEMQEVAIYHVANGRIVREEFYNLPG